MTEAPLNIAVSHLAHLTAEYALLRKRLVAHKLHARELLLTLARATGGWIEWQATTLKELAEPVSGPEGLGLS